MAIDPIRLRQVAGSFVTGVTVLLAYDDCGDIIGMTANSFLSVSLEPPLVLFSVRHEARFLDTCEVGHTISINILAEGQEEFSDIFAGRQEALSPIDYKAINGQPLLPDTAAWYITTVDRVITCGDHDLIISRVEDLYIREEAQPLVYYRGYCGVVPSAKDAHL